MGKLRSIHTQKDKHESIYIYICVCVCVCVFVLLIFYMRFFQVLFAVQQTRVNWILSIRKAAP